MKVSKAIASTSIILCNPLVLAEVLSVDRTTADTGDGLYWSMTRSLSLADCPDLAPYVEESSQTALEVFRVGGQQVAVPDPVFFLIPETLAPYSLCLNLTVPEAIGDVTCDNWSKCWMVVGIHADSSDATKQDYNCACHGTTFNPDTFLPPSTDACGLANINNWGVTCPDVVNGRGVHNLNITEGVVSILTCPPLADSCNICGLNAGPQKQFRVGMQWITNVEEQCFNSPLSGTRALSNTTPILLGVMTGFLVGVVDIVSILSSFW